MVPAWWPGEVEGPWLGPRRRGLLGKKVELEEAEDVEASHARGPADEGVSLRAHDAVLPVGEPASNVRLVERPPARRTGKGRRTTAATALFAVADGSGCRLDGAQSRAEAIRLMSRYSLRRGVALPLEVIDRDGRRTGDRMG